MTDKRSGSADVPRVSIEALSAATAAAMQHMKSPISVVLPAGLLAKLDAWIALQPKRMSRPEAIRHAVSGFLASETTLRNRREGR